MASPSPLQPAGETSQDHPRDQEKPFNFLGLPSELRLMIYSFCLVPSSNKCLRSSFEMRYFNRNNPSHLHSTSILRLSRAIYTQVLPILYSQNVFHHSIAAFSYSHPDPIFWSAPNFSTNLPLMRSMTLDFSERSQYGRVSYAAAADNVGSIYLKQLKTRAINLRNLSLHFVAFPIHPLIFEDLPGDGEIAKALREIKPRLDSLTIVGFGNSQERVVIEALCVAVAEKSQWKKECSRDWSGISLRQENAYCLTRHMSTHNPRAEDAVHRWSWSRRAVLREEKAREAYERSREGKS